jgi:signal transduction histidine kinase
VRRTVAQWFALANAALLVIGIGGVVAGLLALDELREARVLTVDRLQPSIAAALRLDNALVNQETGVRGYSLTRDESFLAPYRAGQAAEPGDRDLLMRLNRGTDLEPDVRRVRAAATLWRVSFAAPAVAATRLRQPVSAADQRRGKRLFDTQRMESDRLKNQLEVEQRRARADLDRTADRVSLIFGVFGGVLILSLLAAAATLRRQVVTPLRRLTDRVRTVAGGDFDEAIEGGGAREVDQLAGDVDDMRRQILAERDDLARSNAELELFAYVASHDLQEPLRKIASFTQMLQRRYGGQLDDRADSYIEFAVDGAKRMQNLINDLLAFSRVGRLTETQVVVDSRELVDRAVAALSDRIEELGGRVEITGDFPPVRGEPSLLTLVFTNLIGNGLKFHGDDPPVVRVSCADHTFTVADNGIGIEPEYADRIFVIFQRLHTRDRYDGTGIGLAICRKIVDYHGGRIWLDTGKVSGSALHFTLPPIEEDA